MARNRWETNRWETQSHTFVIHPHHMLPEAVNFRFAAHNPVVVHDHRAPVVVAVAAHSFPAEIRKARRICCQEPSFLPFCHFEIVESTNVLGLVKRHDSHRFSIDCQRQTMSPMKPISTASDCSWSLRGAVTPGISYEEVGPSLKTWFPIVSWFIRLIS